ncbi:hypothetical protein EVAR_94670_1 [Eumeta japonica]|uniref:Uncharacterized protein n=1 Tax=Eumeta variegata TaxID=151549 RepID=A0A4C1UUC8_EUMVA|nr:hypothetical protein EVAR_94670_1 [Eumeta japonica]
MARHRRSYYYQIIVTKKIHQSEKEDHIEVDPAYESVSEEGLFFDTISTSRSRRSGCGWESLMKSVTLGNVTMSHRERPAECLASLSHSTMIGLPRAALEN